MKLLFVCLGNICRSPTAEGVMRRLVREAGLEDRVELDSAGTGDWHVGSPPDARATAAAGRRGTALEGAARTVSAEDFARFDLLLAADRQNRADLLARAPDDEARAKVRLLREFDPASVAAGELEVPDPYYGADGGFDEVLDIVEAACRGLLDEVAAQAR
jgi:protein-tyrosine phosphatase